MMIAIDPGKSGAIAAVSNGKTQTWKMPQTPTDTARLLRFLSDEGYTTAYLEEVSGYAGGRGAPGSAMFTFGQVYAWIEMGLVMAGFQIIKVRPQKWQKTLGIGTSGGNKPEWKRKLKAKAQELFPGVDVTLVNADALLILYTASKSLI